MLRVRAAAKDSDRFNCNVRTCNFRRVEKDMRNKVTATTVVVNTELGPVRGAKSDLVLVCLDVTARGGLIEHKYADVFSAGEVNCNIRNCNFRSVAKMVMCVDVKLMCLDVTAYGGSVHSAGEVNCHIRTWNFRSVEKMIMCLDVTVRGGLIEHK